MRRARHALGRWLLRDANVRVTTTKRKAGKVVATEVLWPATYAVHLDGAELVTAIRKHQRRNGRPNTI